MHNLNYKSDAIDAAMMLFAGELLASMACIDSALIAMMAMHLIFTMLLRQ